MKLTIRQFPTDQWVVQDEDTQRMSNDPVYAQFSGKNAEANAREYYEFKKPKLSVLTSAFSPNCQKVQLMSDDNQHIAMYFWTNDRVTQAEAYAQQLKQEYGIE